VKKFVLPVGAGVVVFGVVTAFAASLTVNSESLAAGNATVAACQDTANVTYTHSGLNVTGATVTFSGNAGNCDGLTAEVTLTGSGTVATPVVKTATVASDVASVTYAANSVKVADVTGVEVVISG
jgi:hypothetical protein